MSFYTGIGAMFASLGPSWGVLDASLAVLRPCFMFLRPPERVGAQLEPAGMASWTFWRPASEPLKALEAS
eukprot:3802668-Pyramimonas_sp.AAC.1